MTEFLRDAAVWLVVPAVIGVSAIVSAFITLFWGLHRPRRMALVARPAVGSEAFMMAVSGAVNAPLMRGGSARLLNNGVEIFPAMLQALREARRTINFMVYIWEAGSAADQVAQVLAERARAGVQVRLLLDGFGGRGARGPTVRMLREAGAAVHFFNPLHLGWLSGSYKRNHRRAIIVDGRLAFTGGAAIGDQWLGDAQDRKHWRDVMVEVRGCLATNLQSAFTQLWAGTTGEVLVGEEFYPVDHVDGAEEGLAQHVNVISSPASGSHPLRIFFLLSLACARESIHLANSYFAPDRNVRHMLAERARSGVDVRLLLPNRYSDAPMVRWAGHHYYSELLDAGVRIFEYQPTMMHAKMLVVDGVWTVVGSANMDIRSKELNQEGVIGILDESFSRQVRDTFLEDLADAREITREEWARRGLLARLNERFWVSFVEQF